MNLHIKLSKQLQYTLRSHISLSQHSCCSLLENVVLGECHDLFSHVEITDSGFCSLEILRCVVKVAYGVFQTILIGAELTPLRGNLLNSIVDLSNCVSSGIVAGDV